MFKLRRVSPGGHILQTTYVGLSTLCKDVVLLDAALDVRASHA